jgi:hypothetical protein
VSALAASAPSAGGAQIGQLITLAAVYWGGTALVLWLIYAHRTGRTQVLARAGAAASFIFRVPPWAALPVTLAVIGLTIAMLGGLWDIGYHIDHGRDAGPLGNPGHYALLGGIFTSFAGGLIAVGLADQRDATPAWVRVWRDHRAPLGAVLMLGCLSFGLSNLALDDLWHRVFGQDVTLWSPTHFIFLFGGILTVIGMLVLLKEGTVARGRRDADRGGDGTPSGWDVLFRKLQRASLLGGLLCGMELFLAEYDWGVPLYRQVWQPLLIAAFGAFCLVAARTWVGPGGSVLAWVVYAVLRGLGILVPVIMGVSASSMPLFLAEALCVELVAFAVFPRVWPLAYGAAAGVLCGTVGFASEYAWSQLVMPLPWTDALLPEGVICATLAGIGGGLLGAMFAAGMRGELPSPRVTRVATVVAFALLLGVTFNASTKHVPDLRASVSLTDVRPAPHRTALATVRLTPRDAADKANWLYVLAWQGNEGSRVVDRLKRIGEGVYRSTQPIPLHGSWKAGIRFNSGYERGAMVIRLPVDKGLPYAAQTLPANVSKAQMAHALRVSRGAELPAPAHFSRPFGDDNLIVLREAKPGVAHWLWTLGIGLTGLVWGGFMLFLTLGVGRMARRGVLRPRSAALVGAA